MPRILSFLRRPGDWTRPGELPVGKTRLCCALAIVAIFLIDVLAGPTVDLSPLYALPLLVAAVQLPQARESWALLLGCVLLSVLSLLIATGPAVATAWRPLLSLALGFVPVGLVVWGGVNLRKVALRARRMSLVDHLTGVGNRRDFETRLSAEIDRQDRYGGTFSLAVIDLDDFKTINDSWGHAAGDQTLRITAESIVRNTRRSDFVGRLDGDEFGVVMLNTSPDEARRVCNDILATTEKRTRARGHAITASIGCITFDKAPESLTRAMQQADEVMYGVKRMGKGGVASV